jgi:hypothetical protein
MKGETWLQQHSNLDNTADGSPIDELITREGRPETDAGLTISQTLRTTARSGGPAGWDGSASAWVWPKSEFLERSRA